MLGALWVWISEEGLLKELKFGVFDSGRMVAWGQLVLVDGPRPVPPMSISVGVGGLPTGVVERGV